MKKLLQILFFFLLVTQICFAQWYPQTSKVKLNTKSGMTDRMDKHHRLIGSNIHSGKIMNSQNQTLTTSYRER